MKTPIHTTLNNTNQSDVITALCRSLPSDTNAESGLWLPLIPIGAFAGRDGRSWNNSDPEAVINNTILPFILDIDHASETTPNTEASGWITKLKIENNHILGLFELNARGKEVIEDKRYKFYSPAFNITKDGVVHALASVGLTNKPNLNVPALNNATTTPNSNQKDTPMDPELLKALGLAADADKSAVLEAIKALKAAKKAPDLNSFVPQATHTQVVTELNTTKQQLADMQAAKHKEAVETAINTAIADKKIAPADKEFYTSCCSTEQGLADFNKFVETKAPIIGDSNLPSTSPKEDKSTELNSEQQEVLAQMGVTVD
ncbi:phage protease [Psychrobacter raelei]|uniref:Phage protease n=1 Tax=Psychrobacter raelei TaxID=2565531 RepID=A0AAT9PGE8_9GAMM|nr:phage protease [Psychrobacter sp. PraFG1]UNK05833.1 phage protease [Psychrobacter sp. PraFG1]